MSELEEVLNRYKPQQQRKRTPSKQFSLEERKEVERLIKQGTPQRKIGIMLNRHHSSISFEIRRGGGASQYNAVKSHNTVYKKNGGTAIIIERIEALEMQIEILTDKIRELTNVNSEMHKRL